mgnify:CR=1 FL=1
MLFFQIYTNKTIIHHPITPKLPTKLPPEGLWQVHIQDKKPEDYAHMAHGSNTGSSARSVSDIAFSLKR